MEDATGSMVYRDDGHGKDYGRFQQGRFAGTL